MSAPLAICLDGLPLAPSDNGLFRDARLPGGRVRRVLSSSYRQWLAAMGPQHYVFNGELTRASREFRGYSLCVAINLYLPRAIIFTKTVKAKDDVQKFDASNRVKAICDWLADAIGIDDRYFFTVSVVKIAQKDKKDQSMSVVITPMARITELRRAVEL